MPRVPASLLRSATLLASLLVLALAGCAPAPPRTDAPEREAPLILVSIDGFRVDYIDRGVTPNLSRLAAGGVRAVGMKPAFPSLTFPNHYTLATGLYPDHHGIVHNIFLDPEDGTRYQYNDRRTTDDPRWWGGEPIWVGAEKHGVRTATMFWPGSDTAIDGTWPTHWLLYDERYTPAQRVDTVLRWLDAGMSDAKVIERAGLKDAASMRRLPSPARRERTASGDVPRAVQLRGASGRCACARAGGFAHRGAAGARRPWRWCHRRSRLRGAHHAGERFRATHRRHWAGTARCADSAGTRARSRDRGRRQRTERSGFAPRRGSWRPSRFSPPARRATSGVERVRGRAAVTAGRARRQRTSRFGCRA